ncbi:MAG: hypothetical protein FWC53_03660 [Firmicutes bacterium]|nr:hypothetical protein [Bacillota bacterium]
MIKKIYKIIIILTILMILDSILIGNMSRASISVTSADLYETEQFTGLLAYKGIPIICTFVVYQKDGVEYPAYCMNVDLPGVGENGSYTANVSGLITNVLLWNVITNRISI